MQFKKIQETLKKMTGEKWKGGVGNVDETWNREVVGIRGTGGSLKEPGCIREKRQKDRFYESDDVWGKIDCVLWMHGKIHSEAVNRQDQTMMGWLEPEGTRRKNGGSRKTQVGEGDEGGKSKYPAVHLLPKRKTAGLKRGKVKCKTKYEITYKNCRVPRKEAVCGKGDRPKGGGAGVD